VTGPDPDWAVTAGTWWGVVTAPDANQARLKVLANLGLAHVAWDLQQRRRTLVASKPRVLEFVHARPATPADRLAWAEIRAADSERTAGARVDACRTDAEPRPEQAQLL
jgi:hypothetical protein